MKLSSKLDKLRQHYHDIDWNYFEEWDKINAYVKALEAENKKLREDLIWTENELIAVEANAGLE